MKCCVSTDVGTWTNWLTFEPDPDYSPDAGTGLLSPIQYALQRGILLRRENPTYWRGRSLQRGVVLKWFYSPRAVGTPLSEVRALYRVPSSFEWRWVILSGNFITSGKSHILGHGTCRRTTRQLSYRIVSYWVTPAKYSMTRSIAQPLCYSWDSCPFA